MGSRGFVFSHFSGNPCAIHLRHLIVENHGIDRIRRKNFKSLRGCSWQLRPCSRSLPELFCQCLGSSDYHRHRGGLSAAWPRRFPCADECSHPLCRQVGGGMYKETTLHSFEVHQKSATLFSFICLYVYSYPQVNDEKLCKGFRGCGMEPVLA